VANLSSASPNAPLEAALDRYRSSGLFIRLFTRGRSMLAPLRQVAAEVPAGGRILDLGCGHGLFSTLMALGSPEREVLGIDPSAAKIAVARQSAVGLPNLRYLQLRAEELAERDFTAIAILDVLYLLPDHAKLALLQRCRELLRPDGLLLLKTNDTRPVWKYAVVRLEEELMVRVLGFTLGGQIHFRGVAEYLSLLDLSGFEAAVQRLDGWLPVPHRLFVCRPR
jgi:2-polyprenyl-3-methyl-5-hydroxy-6-metoxy-1,4-benzoquinol methylase